MKFILKVLSTIRDFVWLATRHWISAIGVVLTSVAAISFLAILALELGGRTRENYSGIISYLLLPAVFVIGLVLIPIGLRQIRKREKAGQPVSFPVFNFNDPRLRSTALLVVLLTILNLMIVSTATFKGLEVMHSDSFCGGTCHNVMQPEAVAHLNTTHARVYCVDCHIGEGASHFVKAKLRGSAQMVEFLAGDYPRPVPQPTPVPSAICTRCHATERFSEDRLHIRRTFGDGEKAVETYTIFRMLVGGHRDGKWQGIHRHNAMKVRYLADPKRTTITDIEVTRPDGSSDRFTVKDAQAPAGAQWYEMGCTDCHSRPAHRFFSPEAVVDKALARGAIARDLPFVRRESVAVLKASYPSQEEARRGIPTAMTASYAKLAPDLDGPGKAKVAAAGALLAEEWSQNNFPDMKVTWGTYVDFLQHQPGCWRCHDNGHVNAKGDAVTKKCSGACHEILATDEEKPEAMDVLYP
ncbi:MAG TPA: NapC/NirT family cytochrome c [Myxococcaceae bacterium]|nr:NapC/NirT family cytochrome c [Myxococcaceae bacterium]